MIGDAQKAIVLVVDAFAMRCAGITTLVNEWVRPLGKSAQAVEPGNIGSYSQSDTQPDQAVCLVILSVGGCSLREVHTRAILRAVRDAFPAIPCAVLSDHTESDEAIEAASCGYQAFISTGTSIDLVHRVLAFVMSGGAYFPREALLESAEARNHQRHMPAPSASSRTLTPRQTEVLERLRSGKSNKLIARELDMQESTVKVHVRQIMRKLGAANRTQAAIFAMARDNSTSGTQSLLMA